MYRRGLGTKYQNDTFRYFSVGVTNKGVNVWLTADTEGMDTEGAGTGDLMGDVAKFFGGLTKGFGDVAQAGWRFYGDASQFLTGSRGIAPYTTDKVADFYDREVSKKSDLRGAETETFLSGLPYVGDFLRGVEGVFRLEDLYNNTGKLPAYPAGGGVGAGALGHSVGQVAQKIADGKSDLYEYYAGSPDDFRQEQNNSYW